LAGEEELWIGVDCGGTRARAARVAARAIGAAGSPTGWHLAGAVHVRAHAQSGSWLESALQVCCAALRDDSAAWPKGPPWPRLALACAGAKTADRRGIAHALHGPSAPRFLEQLEARLAQAGASFERPIAGLYSDGRCAALAEWAAEGGAFAGARWGYFLQAGTGLAEAVLWDGSVRALDELQPPWPRAYEMDWQGASFEDALRLEAFDRADERERSVVLAELIWRRARQLARCRGATLERVVLAPALAERAGSALERTLADSSGADDPPPPAVVASRIQQGGVLGAVAAAWEERAQRSAGLGAGRR
jgi:hypothetical protein